MDFRFKINDLVQIDDTNYTRNYGKIGEIIGFAEDAFFRKPGYAVQFDNDNLTYFFPETSLSPIGKQGNRIPAPRSFFWVKDKAGGDRCIKIREQEDFETLKPIIHQKEDVLIVELPEIYEWEYCFPFFKQELPKTQAFQDCHVFIIDASRWNDIGKLGVGMEIPSCINRFQAREGTTVLFVGIQPFFYKTLTMVGKYLREMPKNTPTLDEAFQMINKMRRTSS